MKHSKRFILILVFVVLVLALPTTALANKKLWTAKLSFANELHQVVGSSARGSAVFSSSVGGGSMSFGVQVQGLSGPVGGVHIHAPATTEQNAPVILTLCGNPAPAAVASCTVTDGTLYIQGTIDSSLLLQWGITNRQFIEYLDNGMAYVNVHTALNPAGEARGQIYPR